jgi:hypothetical protein
VTPHLGVPYAVGGGVQAVGSSLLASGGTVLTVAGGVGTGGVAVAPGIGAVLPTMALDAAVGVLVTNRAIAHVAAYHGYDVADPQERLFGLDVLSLRLAEDSRREAAYRELTGVAEASLVGRPGSSLPPRRARCPPHWRCGWPKNASLRWCR